MSQRWSTSPAAEASVCRPQTRRLMDSTTVSAARFRSGNGLEMSSDRYSAAVSRAVMWSLKSVYRERLVSVSGGASNMELNACNAVTFDSARADCMIFTTARRMSDRSKSICRPSRELPRPPTAARAASCRLYSDGSSVCSRFCTVGRNLDRYSTSAVFCALPAAWRKRRVPSAKIVVSMSSVAVLILSNKSAILSIDPLECRTARPPLISVSFAIISRTFISMRMSGLPSCTCRRSATTLMYGWAERDIVAMERITSAARMTVTLP
mmetsp:Transcript_8861/g.26621  ORF Transcript_8861/g.26621 Transcript_8861/m.26621 type:complete len:267 (-) Transcript_8861:562-1362(-)